MPPERESALEKNEMVERQTHPEERRLETRREPGRTNPHERMGSTHRGKIAQMKWMVEK